MGVIQGRMYDYNNGRFLSVDPFIQSPSSTQSLNPYTYIQNNPLSGTDPTGYIAVPLIPLLLNPVSREAIRQVATQAARVATKALIAGAVYLSARIAEKSAGVVFRITCDSSCNNQNPGFESADPSQVTLGTPVADTIDSSEGFEQADPSSISTAGGGADNGISSQGTIMTSQENDTSNVESDTPGERLDDLIANSENSKRTPGNTNISEFPDGDSDTLFDEFNKIGGDVITDKKDLKVSNLDDGRTVIARTRSRDGRPTLEVQKKRPNGDKRPSEKIRFGQQTKTTTGSHIPDNLKNRGN